VSRCLAMDGVIQEINFRSDSIIPAFRQHAIVCCTGSYPAHSMQTVRLGCTTSIRMRACLFVGAPEGLGLMSVLPRRESDFIDSDSQTCC
jgi:hypothetical protein